MRAYHYAQALFELSESNDGSMESLIKNFIDTVIYNGHSHMLPRILKSLNRISGIEEKRALARSSS